jgi:hypothetical protein
MARLALKVPAAGRPGDDRGRHAVHENLGLLRLRFGDNMNR